MLITRKVWQHLSYKEQLNAVGEAALYINTKALIRPLAKLDETGERFVFDRVVLRYPTPQDAFNLEGEMLTSEWFINVVF